MTSNARKLAAWLAPRLPTILVVGIVVIVLGITMAISYEHEFVLAYSNGQVRWVCALVPVSVDGILMVASVALYWASRHGIRHPWQPLITGAVGIVATIAANMFSDLHEWWLGPAVAASSGVAAVLVGWVAFWLIATQRKIANGEDVQPAANCSCPPPPISLAEALPLAREELRRRGEPAGEQALANRYLVSRHQVRSELGAAGGDSATTDVAGQGTSKGPRVLASHPDVGGAATAAVASLAHMNGNGQHAQG